MGKIAVDKGACPFINYLFKNKASQQALIVYGLVVIVQFILFKWLYPFASFMPDSRFYIEAAQNNDAIGFWPTGYSQFLRLFKAVFQSDTMLVLFQYFFLQVSLLGFVFSLFYFLHPDRIVQIILLTLSAMNPLLLITSNYISADALFTALSFIWLTQLIWLLYRSPGWLVWLHAGILLLAFMMRYNALYYPLISVTVIMLSKLRWCIRLAGMGLVIILMTGFVWHRIGQYKMLTGQRQFAAFAGWQLAANALYAYSHVPNKNDQAPAPFADLHYLINRHLDSLNDVRLRPDSTLGVYYMWKGPLVQYLTHVYSDTSITDFNHYASLAPLYGAYGKYLIRQYPLAYMKYFLWPNLARYYVPPAEFLGQYNYRQSKEYVLIAYMPVLSGMINLLFAGSMIAFWLMDEWKKHKPLSPFLLLVLSIWLLNMVFSVLASPIVLRYQLFSLSVIGCTSLLLTKLIYSSDDKNNVT